ncbi:hypothetical protein [Halalkalibacter oceani]
MEEINLTRIFKDMEESVEEVAKRYDLDPRTVIFILAGIIKSKSVE